MRLSRVRNCGVRSCKAMRRKRGGGGMEWWSNGLLECWSVGVLECWLEALLHHSHTPLLRFLSFRFSLFALCSFRQQLLHQLCACTLQLSPGAEHHESMVP